MPTRNASDETVEALDAFVPDNEIDGENQSRLYAIVAGFNALPDQSRVVIAMFGLMERFPDDHLGTPGPLVHAVESTGIDRYEPLLVESIRRQPSELSVWMLNRILNTPLSTERRRVLLDLMRATVDHPKAAQRVLEWTREFLEHQSGASTSS